MTDYQTWLLEFIAWKLSGTPLELGDFRDRLEVLYAGKHPQPSPSEAIRGHRLGDEDQGQRPETVASPGVLARFRRK